jgi:hypothetical protein
MATQRNSRGTWDRGSECGCIWKGGLDGWPQRILDKKQASGQKRLLLVHACSQTPQPFPAAFCKPYFFFLQYLFTISIYKRTVFSSMVIPWCASMGVRGSGGSCLAPPFMVMAGGGAGETEMALHLPSLFPQTQMLPLAPRGEKATRCGLLLEWTLEFGRIHH